jgi:hypothetical protein
MYSREYIGGKRRQPNRMKVGAPLDPTRPATWEIVALVGLVVAYYLRGYEGESLTDSVGPLWLTVVLLLGALRAVRVEPDAIWSSLVWFRISTAIYFGLGSVLHYFFTYETWLQLLSVVYVPDNRVIVKFNFLIACCVVTILATVTLLSGLWPYRRPSAVLPSEGQLLLAVAFLFGGLGYAIKYFVNFPLAMGAYGNVVVPAMVTELALLAPPGLFLFVVWVQRFSPTLLPVVMALVLADCAAGVLRFSKTDAMVPMLMGVLAVFYTRATFFRVLVASAAMITAYAYLQPLTGYGRAQLSETFGEIRQGSFGDRIEILERYMAGDVAASDNQSSFQRIAYIYSAAPAIDLYDRERPGDSLKDMLTILIPRAVWPNKPIFNIGDRYNEIVYGTTDSSSWMGFYAEAYWNLGWLGVPAVMIPLGVVFFGFSRYVLWILATKRWVHFPNVFLGLFFGLRTDGSLATEAFVICVLAMGFHFFANAVTGLLRRLPATTLLVAVRTQNQPKL